MKKERKLKKKQKLCKRNVGEMTFIDPKGITLIALIITIIILLILAGITINLTVGQRGILTRAQEAGRNYQEAAKREDEHLSNFLKEADDIIDGINGGSKPLPENALAKKVQIGDYVAYDPTAGVTDTSKLSYTSPVGTGSSHGNGYIYMPDGQKFTANNTKWRVLFKDETTGEVVLISETPINSDAGLTLTIKGAIGYLYAEQELNEICKIYGYGTGADTSKTFNYKIGDKVEGEITETITGSGARSITVEDINKITGYNPRSEANYDTPYTHTIFYPTRETPTGISATAVERTDRQNNYSYEGSQYLTNTENVMYKMLFENNTKYWLASRAESVYVDRVYFKVGYMGKFVTAIDLCRGYSNYLYEGDLDMSGAVRPIVYLKSDIQTSGKNASGAWMISE